LPQRLDGAFFANIRANDITAQKGKKTINNDEVLAALEIVELDMMIPQLKAHIERTRPRATDIRI
jgi:uncharacterized small protein (DUF1192 family)